jgi:hypothetical protein
MSLSPADAPGHPKAMEFYIITLSACDIEINPFPLAAKELG